MRTDARISVGLPQHPKTKKLIRRLGTDAAWRLVCLFLWAAQNRPDGNLSGMTDEDIEIAVDWAGDAGAFVSALVEVGFLDTDANGYVLHDWEDHNPWAAGAERRAEKARWLALCKHHGRAMAAEMMPDYARSIGIDAGNCNDSASSMLQPATSMQPAENSSAPSPSPSPSPSPYQNRLSDQPALTTSTVSAREEPPPRALDDPPADSQSPPQVTPTAPALLARAMREAGIAAQPADPRIITLAERGVSAETVAAAAAEARAAKPDERIPVGYVIGIIERWAKDAAGIAASRATSPPARASPRYGNDARSEDRKRAYEALTGRKAPRIEDYEHARIIDITPSASSAFPAIAVG